MMNTQIHIVALPPSAWHDQRLAVLVRDALVSERRIRKDSNLEVEQVRYGLSCQHIEAYTLAWMGASPDAAVHALDAHYLDVLAALLTLAEKDEGAQALAAEARLGATFFPPDRLAQHIGAFAELAHLAGLDSNPAVTARLAFLECALGLQEGGESGFGVVEVQAPFQSATQVSQPLAVVPFPSPAERIATDLPPTVVDETQRSLPQSLRAEIRWAIAQGGAVNFSNPTHNVISEVLHEFVYRQGDEAEVAIRVVYSDGSEAEPFPLRCLSRRPREEVRSLLELPPLRAALLSMRHLDMDAEVDMAWFLNQEASRPRSFAETDAFCYERTLEQLAQLKGPLQLHLYQTGLQPAVVGFYRALVEWLKERQSEPPCLVVVPRYYRKSGGYAEGRVWY